MTADEVFDLLGKLDADEAAVAADLPDLVRLFLATGERTGEALAADWADFDPDAKQLTMSGNVIRATGKGKILNRGKTDNAVRPIPLADWCMRMLVDRHNALGCPTEGPIFPNSTGTIREASNVRNRGVEPVQAACRVRLGHLPQDRRDPARRCRAHRAADRRHPRARTPRQ